MKYSVRMDTWQYTSLTYCLVVIATMQIHVNRGQQLNGNTFTEVLIELANQGLGVEEMKV